VTAAKTSTEFAAELDAAGCTIKWLDDQRTMHERITPASQRGFTASVRRGKWNCQGHTVLVWFHNGDVDSFNCAWEYGHQIRSMVGVRRALGLES
jgi:hypothetical protein